METATTLKPGQIILSQIDALDFWARARWGVKEMLLTDNGIQFNCTRSLKVVVMLDPSDTYTVLLLKYSRKTYGCATIGESSGVYAESLVQAVDGLFRGPSASKCEVA